MRDLRGCCSRASKAFGEIARDLRGRNALRIYILEHDADADADQETVGPFKTAASLIGALRE